MEVKLTPVEFLKEHVPPLGYYRKIVNKALEMEREQIADLQSRLDLAVMALEKFTILNPEHYKDIAGLIRNATDTMTNLKGE